MRAWHVDRPGPVDQGQPLVARDTPVPGRARASCCCGSPRCGVCRTDLHVAEGDLPARRPGVTPGHEVVGRGRWRPGRARGRLRGRRPGGRGLAARAPAAPAGYCARGAENLCPASAYTGWDADGGYAEYLTVPAAYAYPLPGGYSRRELAPLLCAGIIGYRALQARRPAARRAARPLRLRRLART